jgi:hypothetical protein
MKRLVANAPGENHRAMGQRQCSRNKTGLGTVKSSQTRQPSLPAYFSSGIVTA